MLLEHHPKILVVLRQADGVLAAVYVKQPIQSFHLQVKFY